MKLRRWWPLLLAAGLVAMVTASAESQSNAAATAAVKAAFARAMSVHQAMAVPPVARPGAMPTAVDQTVHRRAASTALGGAFAGNALAGEQRGLETAIENEANPDFRLLDAGATVVSYSRPVTIHGATASLSARVRLWAKFMLPDSNGHLIVAAPPPNEMYVDATLVKDASGVWRVTGYTEGNFVPGHGI